MADRSRPYWRPVWTVLSETVDEFNRDNASMMGAAIAFYTVLSLAPLLVVLVMMAGAAYGQDTARAYIVNWLEREVGGAPAQTIISVLQSASAPDSSALPGLVSLGLLLFGATRLFQHMQSAMNHVWNVRPKDTPSFRALARQLLRKRALSFLVLLAFGLLIVLSILGDTVLTIVAATIAELPGAWYVYRALTFVASVGIYSVGVGLAFELLPDVRLAFRDVWKGAVVTALMLTASKYLFGLYLSYGTVQSAYGAAGSVVALLLWIYLSAQVFFFGAELTQVYARLHGAGLQPEAHAERVNNGGK